MGDEQWIPSNCDVDFSKIPDNPLFLDPKITDNNATVSKFFDVESGKKIKVDALAITTWPVALETALNNADGPHRDRAINYLAFLAGISTRLIVKKAETVCNHLVAHTSDRFFSIFGYRPCVSQTMPPNSAYFDIWAQSCRKMSVNSNRLMTILITAKITAPTVSQAAIEGLLRAMCLLSLSTVGLGTLNWAYKASEVNGHVFG